MKIQQMPDALANMIAAGEVVERPASVVKELVENSLDAESSWIKIEIEEAGLGSIKVTDDGEGMNADDCERAFLSHATSKIKAEEDLFHVRTLGFRGEALASIAAVSRMTIKSSTGEEAGTALLLRGGKMEKKEKSDARKGTEIIVEGLFFNTPARLKYMKTIHTELGHITEIINRLALSHPEVKFELSHNGKNLFQSSGRGDLLQIIAQVYGFGVAKKMIPVEMTTLDFSISGFIAKPEVTRASRSYISSVVNHRYIRSNAINKAVLRGYHTLLPIGRSPIAILNIEMDPILVDVNVHPSKMEVRFSKEKELTEAIEHIVRQTFRKESLIPANESFKKKWPEEKQSSFQFERRENHMIENDSPKPLFEMKKEPSTFNLKDDLSVQESHTAFSSNGQETEEKFFSQSDSRDEKESGSTNADFVPERIPIMYPIGQHHGTYILAQNENGLFIVDQHAAQERVKYEFFREKIGRVDKEVQELLLPLTFDFSRQEILQIEQFQEELNKAGVFLEEFGPDRYAVRSHPQWFPKGFEEEIIREIIEYVIEEEKVDIGKIREEAAIMMSCKRSIKANHYLNKEDMFHLLEDLRKTTDPFTCPHGRPIIIHFSDYELEKMFKRIM